jgi:hypothetical protein
MSLDMGKMLYIQTDKIMKQIENSKENNYVYAGVINYTRNTLPVALRSLSKENGVSSARGNILIMVSRDDIG